MQRKSFVALAFTRGKLQVVKLNSGKTRVEKFATVDLPQGLTSNNQVVNPGALAVVIKNVWRELGLRERTVGVLIPEFSTFVKPITLPKIDISELDEAVRWQAQEFLPSGTSDMVMDWKIVGEAQDKYQILTLAMKKAILAGYVDAISEAGFFPLLVKTPSLILTRLTGKEALGKLIVYSNFGEAILLVAEGQNILGSSVIGLDEDVSQMAALIVKHYKNVAVKKIFAGGGDITQETTLQLGKTLGIPVEVLKTGVTGIPPGEVQKYLVPICLAQTNSAGPADETTINLLPSKWVKTYENKRLKSQIWGLLTISTLIVLACLILTGSTYFYLSSQKEILAKEIESSSGGIPKELTEKISEVNEATNKVLEIAEVSKTPQEVINAILEVKPPDVTITNYNLDLDTGKISFSGVAATRESLVKLKEGLEENKDFGQVGIPLSSFEVEVDLEYQVSFTFLPASKKVGNTPKIPQNQNVKIPNPGI